MSHSNWAAPSRIWVRALHPQELRRDREKAEAKQGYLLTGYSLMPHCDWLSPGYNLRHLQVQILVCSTGWMLLIIYSFNYLNTIIIELFMLSVYSFYK